MKRSLFVFSFFFFFVFFVFYFETYSIGPVTVSILWKFFLILFMGLVVLNRIVKPPHFVQLSYLFCIKSFLVLGVFDYPVETIVPVLGWLVLPLSFQFIMANSVNMNQQRYTVNESKILKLERFYFCCTLFLSFSCVPFILGLSPLATQSDLASFGFEINVFQGFFQNKHAASSVLAIVSVSILFLTTLNKNSGVLFVLYLALIISVYSMMKTYVRTGMLMFLVGAFIVYFDKIKRNKSAAFILIFMLIISSLYILSDEVLIARLFDDRIHAQGNYKDIGSGRLHIWETNLNNWLNSGFLGILLGLGYGLSMELMYNSIGFSLVSHSGFVDALVQNGLLGFLIFTFYLWAVWKYILKYKGNAYGVLMIAYFWMYLIFQLVQGGNQFVSTILFSMLLVIGRYKRC